MTVGTCVVKFVVTPETESWLQDVLQSRQKGDPKFNEERWVRDTLRVYVHGTQGRPGSISSWNTLVRDGWLGTEPSRITRADLRDLPDGEIKADGGKLIEVVVGETLVRDLRRCGQVVGALVRSAKKRDPSVRDPSFSTLSGMAQEILNVQLQQDYEKVSADLAQQEQTELETPPKKEGA